MRKIVVAITGASGSIYAKLLIGKLQQLQPQWNEVSLVITDNARQVWQTELGNDDYKNYSFKNFGTSAVYPSHTRN